MPVINGQKYLAEWSSNIKYAGWIEYNDIIEWSFMLRYLMLTLKASLLYSNMRQALKKAFHKTYRKTLYTTS